MYLVRINKGQQLYGGIILDLDSIVEMYKDGALEKSNLSGFLREVNSDDLKRIEKESKYLMKTVNVYSDRGNGTCDVCIEDIKNDVEIKITYELSCDENLDVNDRYSLTVTNFEIEPIKVIKTNRFIAQKITAR